MTFDDIYANCFVLKRFLVFETNIDSISTLLSPSIAVTMKAFASPFKKHFTDLGINLHLCSVKCLLNGS